MTPPFFIGYEMKLIALIALVAFIIALVIVGPLLTIWALNILFPVLAIPYTWQTWVSVVIIGGLFKTNLTYKKK
jgi:hypothetical protein